ncbi:hypothetical protein [Acinetobacter junii]|uniref:hypothetical protein n=1 Tax=Acinetobacter junii TaxID=40215 RepID=UPI0024487CC3|nr:hypothetical protein [Acinetobacter junii]MDH1689590.1 hypothetical protein [Acinetobacter junii]
MDWFFIIIITSSIISLIIFFKIAKHGFTLQRLKEHARIETLSTTITVFKGLTGHNHKTEFRLEIEYECYKKHNMLRIRSIRQNGLNRISRGDAWAIKSPDNPEEILSWLETIFHACEPDAIIHDPRNWFFRTFDKIIKYKHINEIPKLAVQKQPYAQTLSAIIREHNAERWITLIFSRGKHYADLNLDIPFEALKALHTFLGKNKKTCS